MTEQTKIEQDTKQRTVTGTVISNKMDKTIVVQIMYKVKHELYGKYIKRFSKMYAHDEKNACQIGDLVTIQHCRPLSKTKRWNLVEIVKSENTNN
jgi:small subunit ribosomal protein S17